MSGSSVAQQNGILVDEQCRTSAADVYAAGDVANHLHPVLGRVRVEHFNSATHHGAAAARSMLGSPASFDYIHNFWTDLYEHTLQYVGHATTWNDVAVRGSLDERRAVVFYLLGGVARRPRLRPWHRSGVRARLRHGGLRAARSAARPARARRAPTSGRTCGR